MEIYEKAKKAAITIIVIGLIIFFMGIVGLGWFGFKDTKYLEYGGDAYTGIQNAVADTANNIIKGCSIFCSAIGFITSSVGGVCLNYFKIKEFEYEEKKKRHCELLEALLGKNSINNGSILVDDESNQSTSAQEQLIQQRYVCSTCNSPLVYGAQKCDKCGSDIEWNIEKIMKPLYLSK